MACRFAGAADVRGFWELLVSGQEGVGEYPTGRTAELDIFYGAAGSDFGAPTRRGGFLRDLDSFDAEFFGISPREAELIDPQQRLLLELAWEALENAGQKLEHLAGPRTGVFVGTWAADYGRHLDAMQVVADVQSTVFNALFASSSRLGFSFDFRGPELSVNAACASSLVAIHEAVGALRSRRCDVAIVAGVNAIIRPEITQALGRAGVLSSDGKSKFGDASADGYVRGEGGGVLVLKRQAQARADGDRIRALIRGSAINNNGSSSGFIKRPSELAQGEVIVAALADAGVAAADLDYVEAHGTGTTAGDRIELAALSTSIGRVADRTEPCLVGSVKTNIGHTEAAAGVAGVIKTVLMLEQRYLPPTLHVDTLNPGIDWSASGIALNTTGRSWPDRVARRAGVSAFGIGGTNAHVILEEAPGLGPAPCVTPRTCWLLPLSASSPEALKTLAANYAELLELSPSVADLAFTAARRRSKLPHRLTVVGSDAVELASRLRAWVQGETPPFAGHGSAPAEPMGNIVLVFPGQGSQWLGMARELIGSEPVFDAAIVRCDAAISEEAGFSVRQLLMSADIDWAEAGIEKVQPALFSIQVALADLWASWGVRPSVVVGHSMGEVAAAHVAGVLNLEQAASIICRRAALMTRFTGQGGMALVELSLEAATAALRGYEDRLSVAVSNGPRTTIVSGDPQALRTVVERLQGSGVFCRPVAVQVAAHSPQMSEIRDTLLGALHGLDPQAGNVAIYSTTLGRFATGAEFAAPYWADNLRQPVLFYAALKALLAGGSQVFIEVSPHPILLPAIEESSREHGLDVLAQGSMRRGEPEQATMLAALGRLFVHGVPIKFSRLYPTGRLLDVPGHPFQRRRYWPATQEPMAFPIASGGHPLLPTPFRTADGSWIWTARLALESLPWLKDHVVRGATLLPASAYIEMAIMAGRKIFGHPRVSLETLQLKEAIVFSGTYQSVQLVATFDRPGHWSLKFHTHDAAADCWMLAATGTLRSDDTPVAASLRPAELQPFEGGPREQALSGQSHASRLKRLGYDFGPNFLNLLWLEGGSRDLRAAARLKDGVRTTAYGLHPALLDAGFQGLVAAIGRCRGDQSLLLPRRVGRARICPAATDARAAYVYAALIQDGKNATVGDVRLYGEDGALLADICGLEFQALSAVQDGAEAAALYSLDWVVAEPRSGPARLPDTWLVFPDAEGVGEAFASAMRLHGQVVDLCKGPLTSTQPLAPECGIVHFKSLDLADDAAIDRVAAHAAEIAALATQLTERGAGPLWLVTRGACAVSPGSRVSVPQASIWGLGATIINEYPNLRCRLIDLAGDRGPNDGLPLAAEILRADDEPRVAWRGAERYVARLRVDPPTTSTRPLQAGECAELRIGAPGVLDSMSFRRAARRAPAAGEIEIKVEAAGINFLDIMRAMGLFDPITGRTPKLGVECAGRVVRVGAGVTEFEAGDRVVALSPAFQEVGTLASHLVTRARLAAKISARDGNARGGRIALRLLDRLLRSPRDGPHACWRDGAHPFRYGRGRARSYRGRPLARRDDHCQCRHRQQAPATAKHGH